MSFAFSFAASSSSLTRSLSRQESLIRHSRTPGDALLGSNESSKRLLLVQMPRLTCFQRSGKCLNFWPKNSAESLSCTLTKSCHNLLLDSTYVSSLKACSTRLSLRENYTDGTLQMARSAKVRMPAARSKSSEARSRSRQLVMLTLSEQSIRAPQLSLKILTNKTMTTYSTGCKQNLRTRARLQSVCTSLKGRFRRHSSLTYRHTPSKRKSSSKQRLIRYVKKVSTVWKPLTLSYGAHPFIFSKG